MLLIAVRIIATCCVWSPHLYHSREATTFPTAGSSHRRRFHSLRALRRAFYVTASCCSCPHGAVQYSCCTSNVVLFKLKNVSSENDRFNGWNSTLQAAWYIRHVRIIWFLLTKPTIWLLLPGTQFYTKYRSRVFYVLCLRRIYVGDSPGCCQGQQDDFPQPFCALILFIHMFSNPTQFW